jgi:hypothetical protein
VLYIRYQDRQEKRAKTDDDKPKETRDEEHETRLEPILADTGSKPESLDEAIRGGEARHDHWWSLCTTHNGAASAAPSLDRPRAGGEKAKGVGVERATRGDKCRDGSWQHRGGIDRGEKQVRGRCWVCFAACPSLHVSPEVTQAFPPPPIGHHIAEANSR